MNSTRHQEILELLRAQFAPYAQDGVTIPPTCIAALGTEYIAYEAGTALTAVTPFRKDLTTPIGTYQGGILMAAIDNVYGPLSYFAVGRPAATIEMQVSYLRPFCEADKAVVVEAKVVAKTKQLLFMEARAISQSTGKLIAISKTTCILLQQFGAELAKPEKLPKN